MQTGRNWILIYTQRTGFINIKWALLHNRFQVLHAPWYRCRTLNSVLCIMNKNAQQFQYNNMKARKSYGFFRKTWIPVSGNHSPRKYHFSTEIFASMIAKQCFLACVACEMFQSLGFDLEWIQILSVFLKTSILKFRTIPLAVLKLLTSACSENGRVEARKVTSGNPSTSWKKMQKK